MTWANPGSVKIKASRDYEAHSVYPCMNEDTKCFNFGEDGTLENHDGVAPRFDRLCPSTDIPTSNWTFEYEIWSKRDCEAGHGEVLNNEHNDNNLVCFDAGQLTEWHRDENYTNEWLDVGENLNSVLCLSRNATKDWDFTVCEDLTPEAEYRQYCNGPNEPDVVLDCGCYPDYSNAPASASTLGGGRHGPKLPIKDILCHFFPRLPFCHDHQPEPTPVYDICKCDFDIESLADGCEPVLEADCTIRCGNY